MHAWVWVCADALWTMVGRGWLRGLLAVQADTDGSGDISWDEFEGLPDRLRNMEKLNRASAIEGAGGVSLKRAKPRAPGVFVCVDGGA